MAELKKLIFYGNEAQLPGPEQREDAFYVVVDNPALYFGKTLVAKNIDVVESIEAESAGTKVPTDKAVTDYVSEKINALPTQFLTQVLDPEVTETTNKVQIQIAKRQEDGSYSTSEEHGVVTLIAASERNAGLMTADDKKRLDSLTETNLLQWENIE